MPPRKKKIGRPPKKTGDAALLKARRAEGMMHLRLAGYTLQAIGDAQSPPISAPRVYRIIADAMADAVRAPAQDLVEMELQRLDAMHVKQFEGAVEGDAIAVDRALAIMDRRIKLLGLNAPDKAEVVQTISGGVTFSITPAISKL